VGDIFQGPGEKLRRRIRTAFNDTFPEFTHVPGGVSDEATIASLDRGRALLGRESRSA